MHTLPLLHRWGGIQPEVQMEVWRCHGISRLARWLGSAAKQSKGFWTPILAVSRHLVDIRWYKVSTVVASPNHGWSCFLRSSLTHSLTHSLQRTDAILVLFISTCTLFSFLKVPYPKVPQSLADSPCIHHVFCPFEQPSQHPQIFHGHRKLSQFLSHASSQDENIRGGPENREQFTVGTESQPGYFCLWLDVSLYFSIHVFLWMVFFNVFFFQWIILEGQRMQWVLGELDLPTFPRCRTMMSVSNLRWGTWPRIQWGLPNQWISVGTPMMSSMFIASFHTHFPEKCAFWQQENMQHCKLKPIFPGILMRILDIFCLFPSSHGSQEYRKKLAKEKAQALKAVAEAQKADKWAEPIFFPKPVVLATFKPWHMWNSSKKTNGKLVKKNGDFHQNIKTWWLEAAKNSRRGWWGQNSMTFWQLG